VTITATIVARLRRRPSSDECECDQRAAAVAEFQDGYRLAVGHVGLIAGEAADRRTRTSQPDTIRGSKVLSRSRGTSISTSPTASESTVFDRDPVLDIP
jgi:hypothetical protein